MKISEIPGNHRFTNYIGPAYETTRWEINIICEICELHILMNEKEIASFPKGVSFAYDTDPENVYKLLTCAEMVIKNILE